MATQVKSIIVNKLHGIYNYQIDFCNNKVVLVGENGVGKTTLFKILYYALARDWDALRRINFEHIEIFFSNEKSVKIRRQEIDEVYHIEDVDRIFSYSDRFMYRHYRENDNVKIIRKIIEIKKASEIKNNNHIEEAISDIPFSKSHIMKILDNSSVEKIYEIEKKIDKNFDAIILYLPTYRRIEEKLENIFPEKDREDRLHSYMRIERTQTEKNAIESTEFGMKDVEENINNFLEDTKEFLRTQQNKLTLEYLNEIINDKYEKIDTEELKKILDEEITSILDRIDTDLLSKGTKEKITKTILKMKETSGKNATTKDKIICHYFSELKELIDNLKEEESAIDKFTDVCNKYLVDKKIEYDNKKFICTIQKDNFFKDENKIRLDFQDLSSGEKQIVSIFCNLYLNKGKKIFVFIDEPEISLSVDWQRNLLVDIVNSANCVGLFSVTHSPFIFENELEQYTHGINEFRI